MRYATPIPDPVRRAHENARALGFELAPAGRTPGCDAPPSCCIDPVGALLRTLAAGCVGGRVAEAGSGAGVGTAWLASGLPDDGRLLTVEIDPGLAASVERLFEEDPRVEVRVGDWFEVLSAAAAAADPFDLLFLDSGASKVLGTDANDEVAGLVRIGGTIVMDDLTPEELWPESWRGRSDPKRELAFGCERLTSCEVRTTARTAALLMTRIR